VPSVVLLNGCLERLPTLCLVAARLHANLAAGACIIEVVSIMGACLAGDRSSCMLLAGLRVAHGSAGVVIPAEARQGMPCRPLHRARRPPQKALWLRRYAAGGQLAEIEALFDDIEEAWEPVPDSQRPKFFGKKRVLLEASMERWCQARQQSPLPELHHGAAAPKAAPSGSGEGGPQTGAPASHATPPEPLQQQDGVGPSGSSEASRTPLNPSRDGGEGAEGEAFRGALVCYEDLLADCRASDCRAGDRLGAPPRAERKALSLHHLNWWELQLHLLRGLPGLSEPAGTSANGEGTPKKAQTPDEREARVWDKRVRRSYLA